MEDALGISVAQHRQLQHLQVGQKDASAPHTLCGTPCLAPLTAAGDVASCPVQAHAPALKQVGRVEVTALHCAWTRKSRQLLPGTQATDLRDILRCCLRALYLQSYIIQLLPTASLIFPFVVLLASL